MITSWQKREVDAKMVDANTMEKETVRLYDKQPYETEFETKVVSCEEAARDGKGFIRQCLPRRSFSRRRAARAGSGNH